jgi:outer membrane lipoprotein-sorting protein
MVYTVRTATVAVALAALLVTSGCTALSPISDDAPEPPTDDAAERFASLENLQATQVSTFTTVNGTNNTTAAATGVVDPDDGTTKTRSRIRIDFDGERRQYSRQLAPEEDAGDRVVVNESVSLVYDASENEATRIPRVDSISTQDRSAYIARIVEAARSDEAVVEPTGDVSPLPVVPATSSDSAVPADDIEGYRVDYLGTKTVADRTAHGFRMTAVSAAAMDLNRTMWLDAEFYYPLRTNQTLHLGDRTMHVTRHLENVTFNGDLPEDAFQADLPEDATVNTTGMPTTETYDSREALREKTELSVPDPAVPDEYDLDGATRVAGNFSQVSLQYTDNDGRIIVSKTGDSTNRTGTNSSHLGTSGENVTVSGHDGRYLATGSANLVTWSCDDHSYSVVATALDREELLEVAASVACE